MMEYKGYIGKVEFDDEANIFHGEVINLRDVVTFQGETVGELREAFKGSVDDYLEFVKTVASHQKNPTLVNSWFELSQNSIKPWQCVQKLNTRVSMPGCMTH